jgi:tetraacyldisaccharide 4'-kinase
MKSARPWLLPLVPIYRLGLALARLRPAPVRRLRWPVVSIGNLSTGGAGKTPLTIALAKALTARGLSVDVLSRGYGRKSRLPARVAPSGTAEEFGDEPLVIAREAGVEVYVAAQRYEAGLMAERDTTALKGHDFSRAESPSMEQGALAPEGRSFPSVHLLDDGFQHLQLARDVDILLLNRRDWTDSLLPAGNLREPLKAAHRAGVIAIPADDPDFEAELRAWGWQGTVWRLHRRMEVPPIVGPVAAFCGIARPEQFFAGLVAAGLHVASRTAFADHHRYVQHDLDCLLDAARSVRAAAFITTEKDLARLGKFATRISAILPLKTAQLRIEIEDEQAAIDWLIARCSPVTPSQKSSSGT